MEEAETITPETGKGVMPHGQPILSTRATTGGTHPVKKTRKRRPQPKEFPIEKAFAALLKLDEVIGEFPFHSFRGGTKMSRDFMRARGKLFDELMSNARQPGALARIAAINGTVKVEVPSALTVRTGGGQAERVPIRTARPPERPIKTVTPETLITEISTLDTFIAEQTMGRYFEPEIFGTKIRMIAVGPGEAESVKAQVSAPDKVMQFKGEMLKLLPPETVKDVFEGIIGYRGEVMVIVVKPGSPLVM